MRAWLSLPAFGMLGFVMGGRSMPAPEIRFLAVGQGDCTVYRDSGAVLMIDAGPRTEYRDAGERIVVPRMRSLGIDRIDLLILTHPDSDHIGGLPSLAKKVHIARVVVSSEFVGHGGLDAVLREAGIGEDRLIWVSGRLDIGFAETSIAIHAPDLEPGESDNEGSLFVKLEARGRSALFTGDSSEATEVEMAGRADWRADLLKAGHHGSAGSTGLDFLRAVKPKWVVASCGRDNPYGHPAKAFLARVRGLGLLRTDHHGDIVATFEPDQIRVEH